MGKLKDKYNNWKAHRYDKFREQSNESYRQTKEEVKEIASVYNNDAKLESFAYDFKKPWHQKAMPILKSINKWSLLAFTITVALMILFVGLLYFTKLVDPKTVQKPEEYNTINFNKWKVIFITFTVFSGIFLCYLIPKNIIDLVADKKFKNNLVNKYVYSYNPILTLIFLLFFIFSFFQYNPFNLLPVSLLQLLPINGTAVAKFLLIITSTISFLSLIAYLSYAITTIMCYIINPVFNFNKILNGEGQKNE